MNYSSNPVIWLAFLLSTSVHALFFQYYGADMNQDNSKKITPVLTNIHIQVLKLKPELKQEFAPLKEPRPIENTVERELITTAPVMVKKPLKQKKLTPTKAIKKQQRKYLKQKTKQKKKTKLKLKPKPKPVKNMLKKAVKTISKSTTSLKNTSEPTAHTNMPAKILVEDKVIETQQIRSDEIKKYQSLLLKHIEQYKVYPKSARRRHIQGKVFVSFKLLDNGQISHLNIKHQQGILVKASQMAIQSSLPMPKYPNAIERPVKFSFYMQYKLK